MLTILIIEDDPIHQMIFERLFARSGAHTICADNGLEGIKLARSMPVHGIVVDSQLGDMPGLDMVRHLKSGLSQGVAPIVMVITCMPNEVEQRRAEALAAGAAQLYNKPLKPSDIDEICTLFLKREAA
jgi:CheY-like chemotaxis protein